MINGGRHSVSGGVPQHSEDGVTELADVLDVKSEVKRSINNNFMSFECELGHKYLNWRTS